MSIKPPRCQVCESTDTVLVPLCRDHLLSSKYAPTVQPSALPPSEAALRQLVDDAQELGIYDSDGEAAPQPSAHESALRRVMQVLGPHSAGCCQGCDYEIEEALRIIREAGIEYIPRKAKDRSAQP